MRNQLLFITILMISLSACRHSDKQVDSKTVYKPGTTPSQNIDTLLVLAAALVNRPGEKKEDLDSAKFLLGEAELLNKTAQNETDEGKINFIYSTAFREAGDTATGHSYISHSIVLLQKHIPSASLGDAYQEEANYYNIETVEKINKKIVLYEKAIEQFQQTNTKEKLGYALKYTADLEQLLGNFGKSLFLLNRSLATYQEINFKKLQTVYDLMAIVNSRLGDYPNAVKYGLLGVQNAEAVGDTNNLDLATSYNRLAGAYSESNQFADATIYGQKALKIALKYNAGAEVYDILILITYSLMQQNDWRKALDIINQVESTVKPSSVSDSIHLFTAHGVALIEAKDLNNAYKYIMQLERITKQHLNDNTTPVLLHAYSCMIQYKKAMHQYKEMYFYVLQYISIANKYKVYPPLRKGYLYLATSDSALGDFKNAYNDYKEYTRLLEAKYTQARSMQFAQLQVLYQTDKKNQEIILKQKDIALLKNQNNLQELNLQKGKTTRNVIIVSALSLLAVLSVGYVIKQRYSKQLEKKQKKIDIQNATLKELLSGQQKLVKEKEWLVKEIHHRVKNNLQIVISLFNTQSQFLDNPSALEAIKEGRERMQAIALIHQKLYQPEQGSLVKMASYIPEMVDNLKSGFADIRNIIFQLDVDEINLDASQAVPVGLILNEAITNAIKYAFPARRQGIIQVLFKQIEHEKTMLKIKDNGVGLSEQFDTGEYASLGIRLIKLFSEQLEADLHIENNNGLEIALYFKPQHFNITGD